jgi:uncharacterized repeat protein (TIGR03847 family)
VIFELDPVDRIGTAAVGEPGRRQFYLVATGLGRSLTLACEKAQIQALVLRLHQIMESQGIEIEGTAGAALSPGEPDWQVGEMGLGYHDPRKMFVLVTSEVTSSEGEPAAEGRSIRFWLSHRQAADFAAEAERVMAAGRPLCPRCGLPMDPADHPCPVNNGARPIF